MAGQPKAPTVPAWIINFDVSAITMRDNDLMQETTVVKAGVPFDLWATFNFTGWLGAGICGLGAEYTVHYSAEGQGANAPELDFPNKVAITQAGQLVYSDPDTTIQAVINDPGVYVLSCYVTFKGMAGLTGFSTGTIIEVYA